MTTVITKPMYDAAAVTKSDVTVIPTTRAIYVGGTGDVAVQMFAAARDGSATTVVFSAVPTGTTLHIAVNKVLSTGTTATLLLALY